MHDEETEMMYASDGVKGTSIRILDRKDYHQSAGKQEKQPSSEDSFYQTRQECMNTTSFADRRGYIFTLVSQGKTDEEIRWLLECEREV